MVEIKEEYNKTFKVAFADDIKKNYSGNTSKVFALNLLEVINFN